MAILSSFADDLRDDVIEKIRKAVESAENPTEDQPFQSSAREILKQAIFLYMLSDKKLFGE